MGQLKNSGPEVRFISFCQWDLKYHLQWEKLWKLCWQRKTGLELNPMATDRSRLRVAAGVDMKRGDVEKEAKCSNWTEFRLKLFFFFLVWLTWCACSINVSSLTHNLLHWELIWLYQLTGEKGDWIKEMGITGLLWLLNQVTAMSILYTKTGV